MRVTLLIFDLFGRSWVMDYNLAGKDLSSYSFLFFFKDSAWGKYLVVNSFTWS